MPVSTRFKKCKVSISPVKVEPKLIKLIYVIIILQYIYQALCLSMEIGHGEFDLDRVENRNEGQYLISRHRNIKTIRDRLFAPCTVL